MSFSRPWTAIWDKEGRRVLLVAGRDPQMRHHSPIERDSEASVDGAYSVWRCRHGDGDGEVVFVEIQLSDDYKNNIPRWDPADLLGRDVLGSQTVWPGPLSFIWWTDPA
jgi:hypothetical protein